MNITEASGGTIVSGSGNDTLMSLACLVKPIMRLNTGAGDDSLTFAGAVSSAATATTGTVIKGWKRLCQLLRSSF